MAPATTPGRADLAESDGIRQRYGLRAALRSCAVDWRLGACGTYVASPDGAAIVAVGRPGNWAAKYTGIMTCGRIWTCPVCSAKLRAERLARIQAAMVHSGGRWQMLTLTMRHQDGMPLAPMLRGMMRALARTRRVRAVREIWERAVTASVRATEVTHGTAGWHPHVHLLLRTHKWSRLEKAAFRRAWARAVVREVGGMHAPKLTLGVSFSKPLCVEKDDPTGVARYIAKAGCEIVGVGKVARDSRAGLSSWELAAVATGRHLEERAWSAWCEYQRSTKGRRMIELDDRASRFARQSPARDLAIAAAALGEPVRGEDVMPTSRRIEVPITTAMLRAMRRTEAIDRAALARPLTAAQRAEDPVRAILEALERAQLLAGELAARASPAIQDDAPS